MTRLLHTADVHLSENHPERKEGLEEVLQLADDESVDLVTIGGDLFDSAADAEELRPSLRELFDDRDYPVYAIPGNHDEEVYHDELFYGDAFEVVTEQPYDHVECDDARLTFLPFTPAATEEFLVDLRDRADYNGVEILVLHCSLDAPLASDNTGDESQHRYFPVTKSQLAELDFDYFLAGHYHSQHEIGIGDDATFVYPGTPTSVTAKDEGPRRAVLLDLDQAQLRRPTLDTFHYDRFERIIRPGERDEVLENLRVWRESIRDRTVDASIHLDGHIEGDEADFENALEEAADGIESVNETRSIDPVLEHPIFRDFEAKLEEESYEEEIHDEVYQRTVTVFSQLMAEGDIA